MQEKLYNIPVRRIDGTETTLSDYEGNVMLIVNVASKCGLTPQYEALENVYERYQDQGFVVLGFPANEFAGQEPGSNAEIQEFCRTNFSVQFPIFEKIVVKGEGQHPLYQYLTKVKPDARKKPDSGLEKNLREHGKAPENSGDILWNFEKFLVNRQGSVVDRFAPDVVPDDPMVIKAIEAELA